MNYKCRIYFLACGAFSHGIMALREGKLQSLQSSLIQIDETSYELGAVVIVIYEVEGNKAAVVRD